VQYIRELLAAKIASGLVAAHGIDHGGVDAGVIADRSLEIADAIMVRCAAGKEPPPSFIENGMVFKLADVPAGDASN
jgi:hypothetical protein